MSKAELTGMYSDAAVARSDLYCYFYARALQLLAHGGSHVFVCSNSWLDVGYGARLQEYLLKNAHVRDIFESAVERQFSTADINTIISVIRKGQPDESALTRFVSLRDKFDRAVGDASLRRELIRTRDALLTAGSEPGRSGTKYVGDKWGGKYLRAPNIYRHILDAKADKLVRLGDIAEVRFGLKTGAVDFFYLTQEKMKEWGIEPEFLHPIMTTPKESRRLLVDASTLPRKLFMCHKDRGELKDTAALAYIEWGERQGFHRRSSVRSRRAWYDVGQVQQTQIAMNYIINTTARAYLLNGSGLVPNVFHTAQIETSLLTQLGAALNSSFVQMSINLSGRANLGGGALKLELYEFGNLTLPHPQLLAETPIDTFAGADWDVLNPSPARRKIDDAVFDALSLTQGERDAVYEGVTELVENRLRRARSTRGRG